MPSRLIKESIWTSPNLNRLSTSAECYFWRILPTADDFGCYEATPAVVKGKCYPLKDDVSAKDIKVWQSELEGEGLVLSWHEGRGDYAVILTFPKHNYLRIPHRRKTPKPPQDIIEQLLSVLPKEWAHVLQNEAQPIKTNARWESMSEQDKQSAISTPGYGDPQTWDNYQWIAATGKLPDSEREAIREGIAREDAEKEKKAASAK